MLAYKRSAKIQIIDRKYIKKEGGKEKFLTFLMPGQLKTRFKPLKEHITVPLLTSLFYCFLETQVYTK